MRVTVRNVAQTTTMMMMTTVGFLIEIYLIKNSHFTFTEDPEDDYEDLLRKRKRSRNEDKLDAMDRKLKAMKNLIIEDTERYYSHQDGMLYCCQFYYRKNFTVWVHFRRRNFFWAIPFFEYPIL